MKKNKGRIRNFAWAIWEPAWWEKSPQYHAEHPLKFGEWVIFLGEIPNSPSHCVVAKKSGEVVVMVHTNDFRELTEDEC